MKEYNINALFDELTVDDLNEEYKDKLLSSANGSFDWILSKTCFR